MAQSSKEYQREYYRKNKDRIIARQKQYNENKREERLQYAQSYYENNKESVLDRQKKHQSQNRVEETKYHNDYVKRRSMVDPAFKLRNNISSTVYAALKSNGASKHGKSILEYLPYSFQELKVHLESQFEPWMTWDNWGVHSSAKYDNNDPSTWTWNIDHIIPQSKLPYISMEDENFKKCWALENLRPMLSKANLEKGDK